ncbi:MAG: hypothetical protein HS104_20115 [Polyangiaceae bacterium]|nr:hypothetical protein [Polyangiaceae bacterium]MCE7894120.1 hypothetical protein [Sorangiineae bacterium PRO1]MCL4756287.1 hypothetical protein [Myxococcales bacterium]
MDPFAPINGISLERYAELGAALDGVDKDKAKKEEILRAEGVTVADYDAAVAGWTARMQDMSLMGRVATAFMPMYQAALARKKGGAARVSYEDYVHVSALIKIYGFEAAIEAAGVSMSDWTEAGGHWNNTMAANMMQYAGHHNYVSQEEAKIRGGAPPRKVTVTKDTSAAAQAAPNAQALQQQAMMDPVQAAMMNPAYQQSQMAAASIMANPLGFGLGQAASFMTGGIVAGSKVKVAWSDGNQYPASVMQAAPNQYLVQFDNGSQQWVPSNAVSKA